jgi:hypothetical protein
MLDTAIANGMNAAVVYRSEYHKTEWQGFPVVDGDKDDLRFLDPRGGHIVALYAKGQAKKDTSGFVQEI